jgi:hypothetical protein
MDRCGVRRFGVSACLLFAAAIFVSTGCGWQSPHTAAEAAVWLEPVTFRSVELGEPLTAPDLKKIASVARDEIRRAFAGLRITITDRRDAPYRVRIVDSVRDPRFRSQVEVAGASWGIAGLGGHGVVSFQFLASGAVAHAPPGADRATKVEAIGRGIGRSVVHELVHQFFPSQNVHSSDPDSYEFDSAARRVQYYGDMHWSLARPLLEERFGSGAGPGSVRRQHP